MSTENSVRNSVGPIQGRNGGTLLPGGLPGNKGGPGRTPNEIRALARQPLPDAISKIADYINSYADERPDGVDLVTWLNTRKIDNLVRAAEFLSKVGVPSQTEVEILGDAKQALEIAFEAFQEYAQGNDVTEAQVKEFRAILEKRIQG